MLDALAAYIPQDRLQALARSMSLANRTQGAALFADISGFTSLTETLTQALGARYSRAGLPVLLACGRN